MSIIQIPIAELKPALVGLGKIINKRVTLPVLGMVKVDRTKDGWITLSGTNLDQFATVRLEQPGDGEASSLLISYEDLTKALKASGKSPSLEIECKDGKQAVLRYSIGTQAVETPIETLPVEEFPEIPRFRTESVSLPDGLRQSLQEALACASTDPTRLVLNGAYIDVSEYTCHQVVGTNGRQLYASNSFSLALTDSIIVPANRFLLWKEFNGDGAWQMRVANPVKKDESGWLQLSSRRWRFITRQTIGNYPNWRQVVPDAKLVTTTLEFSADGLDDIITSIGQMPCHDAIYLTLGIEVKDGQVALMGRAPNAEDWTKLTMQGVKAKGANVLIYVNRQFLCNGLEFGMNTIEIIDALSPLRMSNGGRQLIVMPVRVNGPEQTALTNTPPPVMGSNVKVEDSHVSPETALPAVSQPERPNMVTDNTTADAANAKSPPLVGFSGQISEALETIDALQDAFKDGITGLKDLAGKLKAIQREHKTTDKELQGFRNTIRSLQSFKV